MRRMFVMGAGSLVGRLLRPVWLGPSAVWQARSGADVDWTLDDGTDPLARAMGGTDCVLCLAGATPGASDFALNARLAAATVRAAAQAGCMRVFLASTMAVYGAGRGPHREEDACAPIGEYGASKLAMERECLALGRSLGIAVTALRLGNVVGADMLFRNIAAGRDIVLDQFADGDTPRRSYIDPVALARAISRLSDHHGLPDRLNVAAAPAVAMGALLDAAEIPFVPRPAPPRALARAEMDLARLASVMPVPDGRPECLIDGWRAAQAAAGRKEPLA